MSQLRPQPVNLHDVFDSFDEVFSPRISLTLNDYDVRLAKVRGEYVWHRHPDTDEFFLVFDGVLDIGLREPDDSERWVHLSKGDSFVVRKGVLHVTGSAQGASIMMVEPTGTLTTGDFDGPIPDHIDSTVGHRLKTSG